MFQKKKVVNDFFSENLLKFSRTIKKNKISTNVFLLNLTHYLQVCAQSKILNYEPEKGNL